MTDSHRGLAGANPSRAIVIGGGVGGLAAARRLAQAGTEVTVLEAAPQLGGLVRDFEIAGMPLERFYHYLVPGEQDILDLIDELGLTPLVEWFPSSIGILDHGHLWHFTTPVDLLRFKPLKPVDRLRAGIGALRLGRIDEWESLDEKSARQWLTELTGAAVTAAVWDPLLRAKFGPAAPDVPAAWMWGRLQQRNGARKGTGEMIGYLRGGFHLLFDALEADLAGLGVTVRTGARVDRLLLDGTRVVGVKTGGEELSADEVLFAGTLPKLNDLVPAELADPRWASARGLGCLCVIFDSPVALTDTFWTNVCDADVPFGGIIEHTNLLPPSRYDGRHVVYLSRYFTPDEDVATADVDSTAEEWLKICAELFPHFDPGQVKEVHAFRTPYGAPLVSYPYLPQIPPTEAHLQGLYLATTAQIYPQDRGMSEGIKRGIQVAEQMLDSGWTCPVCGGRHHVDQFAVTSDASDGGVSAENFVPSSNVYGKTAGHVVRCFTCGHGSLASTPTDEAISEAYADATDEVTLREEPGQIETGDRALQRVERHAAPGRMLDIGCWTGSFLEAGRRRGWQVEGVEPSHWATSRARERGLEVHEGELSDAALAPGSFRLITACDVLEHLVDPGAALDRIIELLEDGGVFYGTVPDAGSRLARAMGHRWWAVVPMHVQYFTRASMRRLLERHGFEVLEIDRHAKVFSARYYAERFESFVPSGSLPTKLVERFGKAESLIAPDFRDRLLVIARKR